MKTNPPLWREFLVRGALLAILVVAGYGALLYSDGIPHSELPRLLAGLAAVAFVMPTALWVVYRLCALIYRCGLALTRSLVRTIDDQTHSQNEAPSDWSYLDVSYSNIWISLVALMMFGSILVFASFGDEPIWVPVLFVSLFGMAALSLYAAFFVRFRWNDDAIEIRHWPWPARRVTWRDLRAARFVGFFSALIVSGPGIGWAFIDRHREGAISFYADLLERAPCVLQSRWTEFDEILEEVDREVD
jgi:tryptophan-rich sensory protein